MSLAEKAHGVAVGSGRLSRLVLCGGPSDRSTRRRRAHPCPASVQDSQGAVLPGATVTLTSHTQGNVLTHGHGRSRALHVRASSGPTPTRSRSRMQGFKTLERTNVVVNANDRFSAGRARRWRSAR